MTELPTIDLPFPWPRHEIESFCRRWQITELAVFGSALRPDFAPESDVDLIASFAREAERGVFDHARMEDELTEILGRPVDLVSRLAVEEGLNSKRREEILETARPVYAA